MEPRYVVGKEHVSGRQYAAVVIEREGWTVVYRSRLRNWTKAARAECSQWIYARQSSWTSC